MASQKVNYWSYTSNEMDRFLGKAPPLEIGSRFVRMKGDQTVRPVSVSEFEQLFGVTYFTHLRFPDFKTFKQVMRQTPWFSKFTEIGTERLWLGHWHEQDRNMGRVAPVSVRYIDDKMGYGLFAEAALPPFTYIGQYTGMITRWRVFRQNQNGYCFHYPSGRFHFKIFMVDALKGGNETRFVNHGDSPNAEPLTQLDRGMLHVFFRTTRKIEYGEEILINYGCDYWMRREKVTVNR